MESFTLFLVTSTSYYFVVLLILYLMNTFFFCTVFTSSVNYSFFSLSICVHFSHSESFRGTLYYVCFNDIPYLLSILFFNYEVAGYFFVNLIWCNVLIELSFKDSTSNFSIYSGSFFFWRLAWKRYLHSTRPCYANICRRKCSNVQYLARMYCSVCNDIVDHLVLTPCITKGIFLLAQFVFRALVLSPFLHCC